ncbi:hypothetical protein [Luedemannella helvata]|uniref:VWFA domain-containing protein n=1 Tax=Luedemannella helvata TaxID=349315 RepID=A0ABN2JVW6_9ACTN
MRQSGDTLVYLLVDTSGSTVLHDVNAGCNLALPAIVEAISSTCGPAARLCIISYGTGASLRLPLTAVADLVSLPGLEPGGLSSMAAGLRLVAETAAADRERLAADGLRYADPVIVIVVDGLPTDLPADVLLARDAIDTTSGDPPQVHIVAPPGVDVLALSGLRATIHLLDIGDPRRVADGLAAVVRRVTNRRH